MNATYPAPIAENPYQTVRDFPLVDAALAVAETGLWIFPCDARKRPCTKRGHKDAVRSPNSVRSLFRVPGAELIGAPAGIRNGFAAVDIDTRDGRRGADWLHENAGRLPRTRLHRSQSGGTHLLFRYPEGSNIRNSAGRLAPGVDIRGEGGYLCWPGAGRYHVVGDARLAEMPKWLIEQLHQPDLQRERPPPGPPVQTDQLGRYAAFVHKLLDNVSKAPEGTKHWLLLRSARALGGVMAAAGISEDRAVAALIDALPDTVIDWENAKKTARWALAMGREQPITLEDRPFERRSR